MATEVSSLVRILNGYYYKDDQTVRNESGKPTALITRDLLGASKLDDSQELDLDVHVPTGWEKRLDLKSGKVYLQRCTSPNSPSSSSEQKHNHTNQIVPKFQDLNFPPSSSSSSSSSKLPLNLFDETSLDLKLVPSSSHYQSVCTLDKVKSALERAGRESMKKRSSLSKSSSPSQSSSSIKITQEEEDEEERMSSSPNVFAAGCPGCLLYLILSKSNPICPRCNSTVPLPKMKKRRIDLNISI
ncbi:hypothetical protein L1049_022418 [Liquidambar formosana]|uniref:GIR1-like zinc ribbon domain-containing protein n=1 Tax=Liquidambar formosana TaxID=63359 RepID=A0AAP0RCW6_LIQFO